MFQRYCDYLESKESLTNFAHNVHAIKNHAENNLQANQNHYSGPRSTTYMAAIEPASDSGGYKL